MSHDSSSLHMAGGSGGSGGGSVTSSSGGGDPSSSSSASLQALASAAMLAAGSAAAAAAAAAGDLDPDAEAELLRLSGVRPPVKRRPRHAIPADKKDDKYWRRRLKNNAAAKR